MVPVGERLQGADYAQMDIIQEGGLPLLLLQRDAGNSPDSRVKLPDDKSCANVLKAGRIAVKREESEQKRQGTSYSCAKTRRNFIAHMKK